MLAQVVSGLSANGHVGRLEGSLASAIVHAAAGLHKQNFYDGKQGGRLITEASCGLTGSIAEAKLNCTPEDVEALQTCVDLGLSHVSESTVEVAAKAMTVFSRQYYVPPASSGPSIASLFVIRVVARFIRALLVSEVPEESRGAAVALGLLPTSVLISLPVWLTHEGNSVLQGLLPLTIDLSGSEQDTTLGLDLVVNALVTGCLFDSQKDAGTRKSSVSSLVALCTEICQNFSTHNVPVNPLALPVRLSVTNQEALSLSDEDYKHVKNESGAVGLHHVVGWVLLRALEDYATDKRGDVGSWVREEAMGGILSLLLLLRDHPVSSGTIAQAQSDFHTACVQGIIKQAMEKINRVRSVAGRVLVKLVRAQPKIPIPHLDVLTDLLDHLLAYTAKTFSTATGSIGKADEVQEQGQENETEEQGLDQESKQSGDIQAEEELVDWSSPQLLVQTAPRYR